MPRMKIVVVDPNPRVTLSAHRILSGESHDVFAANGIADAIRVAQREDPDVVVLDAELAAPYTLRELAQVTRSDLAVVLTSAHAARPTPDVIEDVRIAATVEKPFTAGALVAAVEEAAAFDEEPTLSGIEALQDHLFETIEDEPDVTPRARQLADRICDEFPGLGRDAIHRRLLDRACALALEDEADKKPLASGQVVLQGSVGPVPIEQVFHLAENMPGRVGLTFTRGEQHIDLFFQDRYLVFARGEGLPPGYALGGFLVDQGAIEADALERFLLDQTTPFSRIGEQLIHLGYIDGDAVQRALFAQVQQYASEAIRWLGSTFSILRDVEFPEAARNAGVQLPVAFVLLEGMRQLDEWDRVVEQIGGLSAVPVRLDTDETPALSPRERFLLDHVDGRTSVEDVARKARRPAFEVCCALADLRGRRLLTVA